MIRQMILSGTGAVLLAFVGGGCGTTVGNPAKPSTTTASPVKIQSEAFTLASAGFLDPAGIAPGYATLSEFKFCVTKLKLKTDSDTAVTYNGAESIEVSLGLINISSTSSSIDWGTVTIPVGFTLKDFIVEIHKDAEKCSGADYSVIFNGSKLTKDLEFKFRFDPTIAIASGDTLILNLKNIASSIEQAYSAGKLNNEDIDKYLTSTTSGSGRK